MFEMSNCMSLKDAMNMSNNQAIAILVPMREMMVDQYGCPVSDAYFALGKAIDALFAQPKKGEWIDLGGVIRWACSRCHDTQEVRYNFCPNCGADMRGEE